MPLSAIAEGLLQLVFEVIIKGAGYVLVKYGWYGGRRTPDPDGLAVVLAGFAFWGLVGYLAYLAYRVYAQHNHTAAV
jgi:hypothetical protein